MIAASLLDREAIARACRRHGVRRLRVFGSELTDRFDPAVSDVDFLVDFAPRTERPAHAYFRLKTELEELLGREVDLVVASAVKNPYFAKSVLANAEDVYAA